MITGELPTKSQLKAPDRVSEPHRVVLSADDRFEGAAHRSGITDSTVTFSATGTAITLVGDRGPDTGEFQVAYDAGAWSPPINTHTPTLQTRQILDTHTFTGPASNHTVKLRVVGTSGRPNVVVDACAYTHWPARTPANEVTLRPRLGTSSKGVFRRSLCWASVGLRSARPA
jgi:hypothetical protein